MVPLGAVGTKCARVWQGLYYLRYHNLKRFLNSPDKAQRLSWV